MQRTESGSKLTELILETFRLNGAIINAGDQLVKDLGLTSARWQVLGVITNESETVSGISRRMGISRQNVQKIANRLVKDGFIKFVENPNHLRAKLCVLTSFGKEIMEEVARRQAAWVNEISKNMDLEELTIAVSTMKQSREIFHSFYEEEYYDSEN